MMIDKKITVIQPTADAREAMLAALLMYEQALKTLVDHPAFSQVGNETSQQLFGVSEARAFVNSLKGEE